MDPARDEDFGLEQVTGNPDDRYKFRTSPIRNVGLQPAFFHNGAFTTLEDAVRHHLDVFASARNYDPVAAGVAADLTDASGSDRARPGAYRSPSGDSDRFDGAAVQSFVDFVRHGLLDRRARPEHLRKLIPRSVPSGFPVLDFQ